MSSPCATTLAGLRRTTLRARPCSWLARIGSRSSPACCRPLDEGRLVAGSDGRVQDRLDRRSGPSFHGRRAGNDWYGRAVSALSWSGGKDSALALHDLRQRSGPALRALITTVTADYERISMHGVRRELLCRQARAVGLPLVEVEIPAGCSNDVYEQRMREALTEAPLTDAQTIAFGDLFLADIRAYRQQRLSQVGKEAIFPLWGRDTGALAREFIAAGFEAVLVCIDPRRLDRSFAGRRFDAELLADLPPDVDPCGENGEFHTFVHAGPIFSAPIACQVGVTVERDGFVFCDVLTADA
jgi:uncharacterized protein (TIGR00290 family)